MTTYSIIAIITKIDSENKVTICGVGKHRYEKSKDEVFNLLEDNATSLSLKTSTQDETFSVSSSGDIMVALLAMAMLNKKPLKLTIDENNFVTDVEVP